MLLCRIKSQLIRSLRLSLMAIAIFTQCFSWAAGSSIPDVARKSRVTIEQLAGNPIPSDVAQRLKAMADVFFDSGFPVQGDYNLNKKIRDLQKARFLKILDFMIQDQRIHLLTPEIREKLPLNSTFCPSPQSCRDVRAFYLPLPGLLFLDSSLSQMEMVYSLFHEILHVYQFTYRFPLDLMMASILVDQGKLAPEQAYDFLSYYYETQANWQTLRMNTHPAWRTKFQFEFKGRAGSMDSIIQSALIILTHGGSLLVQGAVNKNMSRTLPDIDRLKFSGNPLGRYTNASEAALDFHELHLQNKLSFSGITPWDSNFHRAYAKAVEKTYFGKLDFIFQNNIPDYQLFNPLHNQYYKALGTKDIEKEDAGCEALLSRALSSEPSPLAFWLSLPAQEFQQCSAYSAVGEYLQKLQLENLSAGAIEITAESTEALADRKVLADDSTPSSSREDSTLERLDRKREERRDGDSLRSYSRSLMESPRERSNSKKSPFLIFNGNESSASRTIDKTSHFKMGGEGTTPDIPVLPVLPVLPQLLVLPETK